MWARILSEAGARVSENVFLRDTALPSIEASDGRRLEVVATGLPVHRGVPLGVDVTMVSPLHMKGEPWARADSVAGTAIRRAERDKRSTYRDLVGSPVLRPTTVACEVGGRWSQDTADLIESLVGAKSRSAAPRLRSSMVVAYRRRWWSLLSLVAQDALASTLVDDALVLLDGRDGVEPLVCDVLADAAACGL